MKQWQSIVEHIEHSTGKAFVSAGQKDLHGGSINNAFILTGENGKYFVKTNKRGCAAMFEAEAKGLQALAASQTIRVPVPLCYGEDQLHSYIVMEYLALTGSANQVQLGEQLAAMHCIQAEQFGWEMDNTIGSTPQQNDWQQSWLEFWCEQRLGRQLELAAKKGYGGELQLLGERLQQETPKLFAGRDIMPSMLHGDLWGGNVAGTGHGVPVIYDPAFYYGDRETDLAMTYLFGGFEPDFYASYQNAYPVDDGFAVRKTFYNIYHVINHLNLFGGSYHAQVIQMLKQVLAELR
ncbi:MAG: hypothetical protein COB77_03345 [Gammaproteobacteria bacterium]|nr:MAG: hypothetical protein COB77_03345 [Gammaproteobacteria bacterium]